jgi:hypothetical protein
MWIVYEFWNVRAISFNNKTQLMCYKDTDNGQSTLYVYCESVFKQITSINVGK